jgi:hypothetical protein
LTKESSSVGIGIGRRTVTYLSTSWQKYSLTKNFSPLSKEKSPSSQVSLHIQVDIGGANGIGKATVELFHRHGAYVVFGDVNDEEGIQFEKDLGTYVLAYI